MPHNANVTNRQAVAKLGLGWIMSRAWSVFKNTAGHTRAAIGVTDFASALRYAWKAARQQVAHMARMDRIDAERRAARAPRRAQGATGREWGRGSYRYNLSVLGA